MYRRLSFFETVIRSRVSTSGRGTSAHFGVYGFIPDVLHLHPFFGLGYNNFSVYYEFVTGKTNWGPHSYYVALLVEGGVVGTLLFVGFLVYVLHRLGVARRIGRALAAAGNPRGRARAAARVGDDRGAARDDGRERVLPHAVVLLLLRLRAIALATPIVFGRSDHFVLTQVQRGEGGSSRSGDAWPWSGRHPRRRSRAGRAVGGGRRVYGGVASSTGRGLSWDRAACGGSAVSSPGP